MQKIKDEYFDNVVDNETEWEDLDTYTQKLFDKLVEYEKRAK